MIKQMLIDNTQHNKYIVTINGNSYYINLTEFESFIQQCEKFMSVEGDGLENMTRIIADQVIDGKDSETSVEELKQQLKFLREVGFLMKSLVIPVIDLKKD
ncbi:hypothetical protein ACSBL2_06725 [Pedobacter sp. AW31-3R]|uniref:hypothetical protein n=1 Tax=Pedobacter sp. AW31-3R TaxID=3445781 RepID=UPI003F9EC1DF